MDAVTIMFYGNRTFLGSLEGLDVAHWESPNVCGVWSVKNIISHMAATEWLFADVFGMFTGATERPMFERYSATYATWNDETVAERSQNARHDRRLPCRRRRRRNGALVRTIPDEIHARQSAGGGP